MNFYQANSCNEGISGIWQNNIRGEEGGKPRKPVFLPITGNPHNQYNANTPTVCNITTNNKYILQIRSGNWLACNSLWAVACLIAGYRPFPGQGACPFPNMPDMRAFPTVSAGNLLRKFPPKFVKLLFIAAKFLIRHDFDDCRLIRQGNIVFQDVYGPVLRFQLFFNGRHVV